MHEPDAHDQEYLVPPELRGFERLYGLLAGLTSSRSEQSFYERLQVLLLLARWQGGPPTLREIGRQLPIPLEALSSHLQRLRAANWLTDDERYYQLTTHARILAFVLQIVAQPWQESDSVAVVTQLYAAASSQELGLGPALLFQEVVSTLEESIRRLQQVLTVEQTSLVQEQHQESRRNVRMAEMALELRERGAVDHDFVAAARMHYAISTLSDLSGQLEQRHLSLLERDLLSSGQITLGDIQAWAQDTDDGLVASCISPFLQMTIPQPWFLKEGRLLAAEEELAGRQKKATYQALPQAQQFHTDTHAALADQYHRRLSELQGRLRQVLYDYPGGLPLAQWVNHEHWSEALLRLIAVLDPILRADVAPIVLQVHPSGRFLLLDGGSVKLVSDGLLSYKEAPYAE